MLLSYEGTNTNIQDREGKTILHYLVGNYLFGYFTKSINLIEILLKRRPNTDIYIKDNNGHSPLFYAYRYGNAFHKIFNNEDKQLQQDAELQIKNYAKNQLQNFTIPIKTVDVDKDAKLFEEQSNVETEDIYELPEMDRKCHLPNCKPVKNKANDKYYNVVLTKTDVKYGAFGYNNFYILQLGYNESQKLYVLLNRYGRVGEEGMFQSTPFDNEEDAVKEFCKIFKSKTGNEFDKEFEGKAGKYQLVKTSTKKMKDPLTIDSTKACASALPKELQEFIALLCDITILRKDLRRIGFNNEYFSLGQLDKETLRKGFNILNEILTFLKKDENNEKQLITTEQKLAKIDYLNEKSVEYYSLLPHSGFVNCAITPIDSINKIQEEMKALKDLIELRVAAKVLLGASLNINSINPLDYCYYAIQTKLQPIREDEDEYKIINKYMEVISKENRLVNIFRVQRKKEDEEKYQQLIDNNNELKDNRLLLWHGTPVTNLISILHNGLQIAPAEACTTGYMFVAVGKPYETKVSEYMEEAKPGYHSTKALGKNYPDLNDSFIQYDGNFVKQKKKKNL
ncbi:hypothetical protein ABK040_015858 [Willaertia magna]